MTPDEVVNMTLSGLSAATFFIFAAMSAGKAAATCIAAVRAGPSGASILGRPCGFFFVWSRRTPGVKRRPLIPILQGRNAIVQRR